MDYDGHDALELWRPLIREEATWDYGPRLGSTAREIRTLRKKVGARMVRPDLDHVPGISVETLAKSLKAAVLESVSDSGVKSGSPLETFLVAEGIVDWVRSHVVYNTMLEPGKIAEREGISLAEERKYRSQFWTPATLLQKHELFAVCAGISRLSYQLAKAVGVPLYDVIGYSRGSLQGGGTYHTNPEDHSWNIFVLTDGAGKLLIVPADPSHARVGLSTARGQGFDWYSGSSFPDTPEDAVAFHYWHYGTKVEDNMTKMTEFQPTTLTERKWREMGTVTIIDRYRRSNALRWINSATSDKMPE